MSLSSAIESNRLSRVKDALHELSRECVRLSAERTTDSKTPIGISKFGGEPDVPPSFDWPMWDDEPMTFLGQINCQQISQILAPSFFPDSGLLYFFNFVDVDGCYDITESDEPTYVVRHIDASDLKRTEMPESTHELEYCTRLLTPTLGVSIPDLTDPTTVDLDLSDSERQAYTKLFLDLGGAEHQLFGHPALIQPYPSSFKNRDLLLQVISDTEDHAFMWGDCGYLYFMIPRGSGNPIEESIAEIAS